MRFLENNSVEATHVVSLVFIELCVRARRPAYRVKRDLAMSKEEPFELELPKEPKKKLKGTR